MTFAKEIEELNKKGICTIGNGFGCNCSDCQKRINKILKEMKNVFEKDPHKEPDKHGNKEGSEERTAWFTFLAWFIFIIFLISVLVKIS